MTIERHPLLPWIEIKINRNDGEYAVRRHSHKEVSLGVITGGKTVITVLNRDFELHRGDSIYIPAEQIHLCRPDTERPFKFYMIYIDRSWLEETFSMIPEGSESAAIKHLSNHELETVKSLAADLIEDGPNTEEWARNWEERFIEFLGGTLTEQNRLPLDLRGPLREDLESIKVSLEKDPCQSLEAICRNRSFSKYSLIRSFSKAYGLSPHAFQLDIRINNCIRWLKEGRDLAAVAQDAGFSDQSHMQRTFKMYTGVTPGEYFLANKSKRP
ncbi:MAG: AraC family transcriptional regulator [Spirochaetales bacterium]|nr:AraC family transcriptional regulator [Spirochaetales bacterium]